MISMYSRLYLDGVNEPDEGPQDLGPGVWGPHRKHGALREGKRIPLTPNRKQRQREAHRLKVDRKDAFDDICCK